MIACPACHALPRVDADEHGQSIMLEPQFTGPFVPHVQVQSVEASGDEAGCVPVDATVESLHHIVGDFDRTGIRARPIESRQGELASASSV